MTESCYPSCKCVKRFVDHFLKINAARQAKLGKSSTDEEKQATKAEWLKDLELIRILDPVLADRLQAQDD